MYGLYNELVKGRLLLAKFKKRASVLHKLYDAAKQLRSVSPFAQPPRTFEIRAAGTRREWIRQSRDKMRTLATRSLSHIKLAKTALRGPVR